MTAQQLLEWFWGSQFDFLQKRVYPQWSYGFETWYTVIDRDGNQLSEACVWPITAIAQAYERRQA